VRSKVFHRERFKVLNATVRADAEGMLVKEAIA
jgi:hypothetical protein